MPREEAGTLADGDEVAVGGGRANEAGGKAKGAAGVGPCESW